MRSAGQSVRPGLLRVGRRLEGPHRVDVVRTNEGSLETDRRWLDAFRQGERWALERVYGAHVDGLARFLRRGFTFEAGGRTLRFAGVSSTFDVEDWLHEVFLRAFSDDARASYDGLRPYRPFLERIARNLVIDELKRKEHKLRVVVEVIPEPTSEAPYASAPPACPEREAEARQLAEHVAELVRALPPRERRVYELRFERGLEQREVANLTALSPSKVKTSERRIRDRFFDLLERHGWLEDHHPGPKGAQQ